MRNFYYCREDNGKCFSGKIYEKMFCFDVYLGIFGKFLIFFYEWKLQDFLYCIIGCMVYNNIDFLLLIIKGRGNKNQCVIE